MTNKTEERERAWKAYLAWFQQDKCPSDCEEFHGADRELGAAYKIIEAALQPPEPAPQPDGEIAETIKWAKQEITDAENTLRKYGNEEAMSKSLSDNLNGFIRNMRVLITAASRASSWQGMDTAPRDGTQIWGWCDFNRPRPVVCYFKNGEWWHVREDGGLDCTYNRVGFWPPICWMHLMAPPKPVDAGGEG